MRHISCSMTIRQIYARLKTETRRLKWLDVKPGDLLQFVDRCMGLKKGEQPVPIAIVVVTAVRNESLLRIDKQGCIAEGFPNLEPAEFVETFASHAKIDCERLVTVINFKYIPGGRTRIKGVCRHCGCTNCDPCLIGRLHQPCIWNADDICSACVNPFVRKFHRSKREQGSLKVIRPSFQMEKFEL